ADDGIRDLHVTGVQTCALPIWQPPLRPGRIDTGHQAGHGMGQDVISDTAVDAQRLADLVQFLIRAYPSYLQRPVTPRVDAGGFEVVPENTLAHYHSPALDRCRVPRTAGSGISGVRETEIVLQCIGQ